MSHFPFSCVSMAAPALPTDTALCSLPHFLTAFSRSRGIREAQQVDRCPYMVVVGPKEAEENLVNVRNRDTGEATTMGLAEFIEKVKNEIETRAH